MPPDKFRVALVQMSCGPEPEQNLAKALERVSDAAGRGAQVVCLPELFQTQYFCQREDHSLFDLAEPIPGNTSEKLAAAARQHGVVLIASLFEKRAPGIYHNTAAIFDPTTNTWAATGSMIAAHEYHSAAFLQDGRVLVPPIEVVQLQPLRDVGPGGGLDGAGGVTHARAGQMCLSKL